ncbi:MAG: molybdenum cofactor biosynthesis protein B [Candidatus Heimdallarchaeota archaeon]
MSHSEEDPASLHRQRAPNKVGFGILTISTSRAKGTVSTNRTLELLAPLLTEAGHALVQQEVILDESKAIQRAVHELVQNGNVDAIVLSGGTGIASSDVTIEAIRPLFTKELSAFGAIFAMLSYEQVKAAAVLSRATAGIINKKPVFLLPGSPKAVLMAFQKIILPEIGHVLNICAKESET